MPKISKNYFKIEMLLLKIISLEDCYGYQITQLIKELTDDYISLAEGTLYPILYKLIDLGFIKDYKRLVGKRKTRIYYSITDSGIEYLSELYSDYKKMNESIDKIMTLRRKESN